MTENIFEIAAKEKFEFSFKGTIKTEDLFDLNKSDLREIYKDLKASIKNVDEIDDELFNEESDEDTETLVKMEIVRYIANLRKTEEEEAIKAKKREKFDNLIYKKENEELENLSVEELKARRDSI